MSISVDIAGLGALAEDFARLKRGAQKRVLRQATMAGARVASKEIKSAAPVDEGDLKRGIRPAAKRGTTDGQASAGVRVSGAGSRHWHFSELGTSKEPARPWIRPTWDSNEDEIEAAVRDRLAKAIDEALGR